MKDIKILIDREIYLVNKSKIYELLDHIKQPYFYNIEIPKSELEYIEGILNEILNGSITQTGKPKEAFIQEACDIIKKDLRMIGLIQCPKCGGELHYSLAEGTPTSYCITGKCNTSNCLHWEGSLPCKIS